MIIGPIATIVGLYQQIVREVVYLPVWGWVLIGVSTFIVAQILAYRSLRLRTITNPSTNGIATQVITVENMEYEFQTDENQVILQVLPEIHAIPAVRVEDIKVEILGKRYETDWEPMKEATSGDIGEYIYVHLPKSLKEGDYEVRIIAYINNKEWPSRSYTFTYRR